MKRVLGVLGLLAVAACNHPSAKPAVAEPNAKAAVPVAAPAEAAPAPEQPKPAVVEKLLVPGDRVAPIVRASDGSAPFTVFMGGVCSNAGFYLNDFREAAKKQGGVVGIEGDQPCGPGVDAAYRTYSWDAGRQHARIEAALAAAGLKEIPAAGITLVGYSQGAALAEQLAAKYPGRYSRIVLIGAPTDPAPRDFIKTRGLVTMACDRDVTARMRAASTGATKAGVPSTYFQMPNCSHGQVNDAENIFGQTFDWLSANEKPADPNASAVRIVGPAS